MCGRYVITKSIAKTSDIVKTSIKVEDSDNYNAHPTQKLPIIKPYTNGKALEINVWGITPEWSKKLKISKNYWPNGIPSDRCSIHWASCTTV